ncbi:hypothetical protein C0989_004381 [Termitomyces sp. Mn162]|nr:hypothetical protein C0989_004381 [Termitomyces sp. Mn162]
MINSSQESIQQFLIQVAHNAQLREAIPAAALVWFCYETEWLMIFDNADDPDLDLWKFFPACSHGNIIITSRNKACIKYAPGNFYKVGEMSNEDSLSILLKASHRLNLLEDEHAAAKELVQELGYLALAIVQAGGYLHYNQHVKIDEYVENYKKDKLKYLAQVKIHNMDNYPLSVFATWDCSYQRLEKKAKEILILCSVLHYSKIPVKIFEQAWDILSQDSELEAQEIKETLNLFVKDGNWDDNILEEALDVLQNYSLVDISREGGALLNIHPLVHIWSYKSLSTAKQKKAQICAQQLFYCINKRERNYCDAVQRVAHLQELLKLVTEDTIVLKAGDAMGQIFQNAYMWDEAEKLQRQILMIYVEEFGGNHFNTINAMVNLAISLKESGKLQEAEGFEQEVLKARTEAFGSKHPETIRAMGNLATTLMEAGKLQEAEEFGQEVLKAMTAAFGSKHPETIRAMGNLAITLMEAGKLQEAEEFGQKVLKARTEVFGRKHPNTITAMENLAITLKKAGKLQEAEEFGQKVLKARTKAFGRKHPEIIRAMGNLAITLMEAGKLQDAEELEQEVLKARTEALGSSKLLEQTS